MWLCGCGPNDSDRVWRADNARHGFATTFGQAGPRLSVEGEAGEWSLNTRRYGCSEAVGELDSPAAVGGEQNHVEYSRLSATGARLLEWYV